MTPECVPAEPDSPVAGQSRSEHRSARLTTSADRPPDDLVLVLLPGLDGTGTNFDTFVTQRPAGVEVQVISYPSDRPAGYEELLELIWEQLPLDRQFILLGESFSGPLAVRVASRQPAGLQGVVLCASFIRSPTPWYVRCFPSLFTPVFVKRLIRLEAKIMRALLGKRQDALRRSVGKLPADVCPEVIAARVRATFTVDASAELRSVQVPLMYLGGRWDLVIPRRCSRLIQRLYPGVELRWIDGPHALLQTRPSEAWGILQAWLDNLLLNRI